MLQPNLQAAINACANDRGDVIVVSPHTYVVTTPVLFNVRGITVIASYDISGQDNGERFTINADATANIAAAVISEPCTLIGIGFDSANTSMGTQPTGSPGTTYGGTIVMGAGNGFDGGNFTRLTYCRITNFGKAGAAIESWANDYLKIDHCDIDGTGGNPIGGGGANAFAQGIAITQGHFCTIEENTFRGCTYAILHGTPNPASASHSNSNFIYKGNRLITDTAAASKLLSVNNIATYTTQNGLVADNWLPVASTAAYSDTVANLESVGVILVGNHYKE